MGKDNTIIKSYKTGKKYKQDKRRMFKRGFNIEHETLIVGELQVEYRKGRNGPMSKEVAKEILDKVQAEFNKENAKILSGDVTQLRIGVTTGLEIALNIVKSYVV